MTVGCHPVALEGRTADGQQMSANKQQLDIAITDDDASTVIHVRGPGGCARMSDLGCVFDKLGVDVISCSSMPSAGSCDVTLVVVDRHDSQPLDDCLKQSVRQGLHSVLCKGNYSSNHSSSDRQHQQRPVGTAAAARAEACAVLLQQEQQQAGPTAPATAATGVSSSADNKALPQDPCRADSASEAIQLSRTCSRQASFTDTLQQQLAVEQLPQCAHGSQPVVIGTALTSGPGQHSAGSLSTSAGSKTVGFSLPTSVEAAGTPPAIRAAHPSSLKPALKIDIPYRTSLLSNSISSSQGTPGSGHSSLSEQANTTTTAAAARLQAAAGSSRATAGRQQQPQQRQQQQGVQAQDLAERLLSLGLHRRQSPAPIMGDSSDDESDAPPVSRSSSRTKSSSDWQRWQGPVPVPGSSLSELPGLLARHQLQSNSSSSTERTPGRVSAGKANAAGAAAAAAEVAAAFAASSRCANYDERDFHSDGKLPRLSLGAVAAAAGGVPDEGPAGDVSHAAPQQVAASPCVDKPRRRPPPRTPSRIILSPVAPDGSTDPQGQPRLFVAIPKQTPDEKRTRRPPVRSATVSAAATPGAGRKSVLAALLAAKGNLAQLVSDDTSPTAAAAAAAASMPYNVAVAAAQLLRKDSSKKDAAVAAAAAAAAVAAASEQQPGSPSSSESAVFSSRHSVELLSPAAATPRTLPPPPATPVHPAVAAAAAAAIAAAAEAAGEAAAAAKAAAAVAAAAKEREALATTTCMIIEGSDEGRSAESSTAGDGQTDEDGPVGECSMDEDGSSDEEWWCGSLTGLTVRDIMMGPLHVVSQDADVSVARQLMAHHNVPGILVDAGPGVEPGFLTRRDFLKTQLSRRGFKRRQAKTLVRDIMSHPVIAFDAAQPIEVCVQLMQEKGVRRGAVRDSSAADPSNHLAEYVGLVSDTSIFRCLGLYAEEGSVLEEEEQGLLGVPPPLRSRSVFGADSSTDASGVNTPYSASRAGTPLVAASGLADSAASRQDQQLQEGQQLQGSTSLTEAHHSDVGHTADTMCGTAKQQLVTLPGIVMVREGLKCGSSSSSAGSMGSAQSAPAAAAAAGQLATCDGDVNAAAAASALASTAMGGTVEGSSGVLPTSVGSGSGSGSGAPDVLSRYRTAASLWEVDIAEMEMIKRIGEGSFGEVMLANYRGTKVAVKRLRVLDAGDQVAADQGRHNGSGSSTASGVTAGSAHSQGSSKAGSRAGGTQAAFRQFFEREIAILASIRHPNVVNFIGACHKPGQRCLVTEYCARGSLDQVLHKSGIQLDLPKRVEFAMDVARGMACLHAQRPIIIHRDLKTANLLVSARFEVKVADFGLSRIKDASHLQVSRAGLEGTIEYCAPEVLRGEPYTERCDVYSFGVVLWELLLRERPYADADVPIFLLMVNIGNGTLKLPDIPEEAATPSLVHLVQRCLSFSAADRPDFREVLQLLEGEYRGLRAAQQKQPRQQAQQQQEAQVQQQQVQPQRHAQQQVPSVLRCDSASSMAVHQSQPVAVDTPDFGSAPAVQSPVGSSGGQASLQPAASAGAGPAGSSGSSSGGLAQLAAAGPDGMLFQDPYAFYQQQHYQQGVLQFQPYLSVQPQPQQQQRSRLSQADSLASSGGGLSCAGSVVIPATGMPYLLPDQAQHHLVSMPLPQLVIPQQQYVSASAAGSTFSSPRAQQQQQQQQGMFQQVEQRQNVLSAFGAASQQQQATPGVLPRAGGSTAGRSSAKPPRRKSTMSRARSLPVPQSISWQLDVEDQQEDEEAGDRDAGSGAEPGMVLTEDSFTSSEVGGAGPHLRCVSAFPAVGAIGQLCVLLDPAAPGGAGAGSGLQPVGYSAAPGGVYCAYPQQPVFLAHPGQVPVVIAQPGCVQYAQPQLYTPQQQAPLPPHQQCTPQQGQQPVQTQPQPQPRMLQRGLFTPSPTAAALGTPPLSSSPSLNTLNPLAVMAAAGAAAAAARREGGSNSGTASPTAAAAAAAVMQGGAFAGHRRSSSQGGAGRQLPPLQLLQMSDIGSPTCLSALDRRGSDTGHSTPVLGGSMVPCSVAAPLLLQRLDSLNRSGSASPRSSSSLHCFVPAPALQPEGSGQLVGVVVAGSGPPSSGNASPLSGPHPVGPHRHASSRLAIQGSFEMPGGVPGFASPARQGSAGSTGGDMGHQLNSSSPGGPPFLHQTHQHLQQAGNRRPSLLRIDSNSRDRSSSPFAAFDGHAAAGPAAAGAAAAANHRSPFAAVPGGGGAGVSPFAAACGGVGAAGVSPFAAAASGSPAASPFAAAAHSSPFAAASGGSNAAAASPFAAASGAVSVDVAHSSNDVATTAAAAAPAQAVCGGGSRLTSPFAAAASPFAAAAAEQAADEEDVEAVDDTNSPLVSPTYKQQHWGNNGIGSDEEQQGRWKGRCGGRPGLSP